MQAVHAPVGRDFRLQWVLANAMAFVLGGALAGAAAKAMLDARGGDVSLTATEGAFTGALAGLVIGVGQWLVLRRALSQTGLWVLITIMSWVMFDASLAATGRGNRVLGFAFVAFSTLIYAVLQWLVIRRHDYRVGRGMIAVNAGAFTLACFVGGIVIFAARDGRWFQLRPTDFPSAIPWALAGVAMGPLYGAITGAALVRLLRQPVSEA